MEITQLESRITNGEKIFMIRSNDLKQLYVNVDNSDNDYTKCIPHLGVNMYVTLFDKSFPILIRYTDENTFEIIETGDRINIINSDKKSFLDNLVVGRAMDVSVGYNYVKKSLKDLINNPFSLDIRHIKSTDQVSLSEKEMILDNNGMSDEQIEMINLAREKQAKFYERLYNDYEEFISIRDEIIQERHKSFLMQQAINEKVKSNFNDYIKDLTKVKTLKKSK